MKYDFRGIKKRNISISENRLTSKIPFQNLGLSKQEKGDGINKDAIEKITAAWLKKTSRTLLLSDSGLKCRGIYFYFFNLEYQLL